MPSNARPSNRFCQCLVNNPIQEALEDVYRELREEEEEEVVVEDDEEGSSLEDAEAVDQGTTDVVPWFYCNHINSIDDIPWFIKEFIEENSRNASRVTSESREAMFKRAMTLLSARCTSTGPGAGEMPFGKGEALGMNVPQYFYVSQEKPRPMPPLKAWNGYNGNVYFEPIQINTLTDAQNMGTMSVMSSRTNDKLHRMLINRKQMSSGKFDRIDSATTRSVSRQTGKSMSVRSSTRQSLILDKKIVMNGYNENIQDDLALIEGVECTGSLAVRPKSDKTMDKDTRRALMYNKERLCKGSVVHRINENRNRSRMILKVNGGKFVSPQTMAPLLRTQTQYSLSNQRLTTNSPDPYHQQLPPLEQLRASVRHMDTADKQKAQSSYRYSKPVTMTEEIKPYIKYSPDIKKSRQQPSYV